MRRPTRRPVRRRRPSSAQTSSDTPFSSRSRGGRVPASRTKTPVRRTRRGLRSLLSRGRAGGKTPNKNAIASGATKTNYTPKVAKDERMANIKSGNAAKPKPKAPVKVKMPTKPKPKKPPMRYRPRPRPIV